jgi:hypothetical protein
MRLGTKVQANSKIQFASNQSKLVPRKLDPCLKRAWSLVNLKFLIHKLQFDSGDNYSECEKTQSRLGSWN